MAANAANAQLSCGPKTPEGRARSSQNACSHRLNCRELVIRDDERSLFDAMLAEFEADLQPVGIVEMALFNQIVHAEWNLRRVRIREAELLDKGRPARRR